METGNKACYYYDYNNNAVTPRVLKVLTAICWKNMVLLFTEMHEVIFQWEL